MPLPAGAALPGPGMRLAVGSSLDAGGGPSTEMETTVSPLKMTKPNVRLTSTGPSSSSLCVRQRQIRLGSVCRECTEDAPLSLGLLLADRSELFAFCKNKVHVLVVSEHLAGERAAIIEVGSEAIVEQGQQLAAFS